MRILVNLVGILKEDSQSLYARSILNELLKDGISAHSFLLVSNGNISWPKSMVGDRVQVVRLGWAKGKTLSFLALQIVVPIIFLIKRSEIIYSPTTLSSWLLTKKSVITIHDLAYVKFPDESNFLSRIIVSFSYYLVAKFSKHIIAISKTTAEAIGEMYKTKRPITVIYNSAIIDFNSEAETTPYQIPNNYILYIGINRERKNLKVLIEALKCINNLNLVIAGDRIKNSALGAFARKIGVEDRIIELGYISSDASKIKLYQEAKLFVFPTLYEGFGLPVLEAQTIGTPIIVSDIPIMHEVVGDGAVFADPNSPESFSKAINLVLSDDKLREDLRNLGFANVKRFSWSKSAETLARILEIKNFK